MKKKQFLTTLAAGLFIPQVSATEAPRQIGTEVIKWANENTKLKFEPGKNNVEWILNQAWSNYRVTGYRGCGMTLSSMLLAGYLAQTQKVLMVAETSRQVELVKKKIKDFGFASENITVTSAFNKLGKCLEDVKYDVAIVTFLPLNATDTWFNDNFRILEKNILADKFVRLDNYDQTNQLHYNVYSKYGCKKFSMCLDDEVLCRNVISQCVPHSYESALQKIDKYSRIF